MITLFITIIKKLRSADKKFHKLEAEILNCRYLIHNAGTNYDENK